MFGNIGFPELLVIMAIALLIFGPKKLPEVGKSLGKALREFRRTTDEIKEKIEEEIQAEEFRDIKSNIEDLKDISVENITEDKTQSQDSPIAEEKDNKKDRKNEREGK